MRLFIQVSTLLCLSLSCVPLLGQPAPEPYCNLLESSQLAGRARAELAQKRYETAKDLFRQAYVECPRQKSLLLELAQMFTSQRMFDQAIQTAGEYLREDPGSVDGHLVQANAYFMAQRFEECRQAAERALGLEPANPTALKLEANAFYLQGNTSKAEEIFLGLLEKHPEDEEGPYMLGRIYYQENRVEYAIGQFQRVLKLNPKSYKAYDNLGLCYEARNQPELAIRYYLTAIKLVEKDHPEYDWPYANLANLLLKQDDNEKAFSAAAIATKRNPYSARNFYLGGKALSKLGKAELSLKWLERSVELDPAYSDALYLLGRVYAKLGQKEKAAEALRRFQEAKAKAPAGRR